MIIFVISSRWVGLYISYQNILNSYECVLYWIVSINLFFSSELNYLFEKNIKKKMRHMIENKNDVIFVNEKETINLRGDLVLKRGISYNVEMDIKTMNGGGVKLLVVPRYYDINKNVLKIKKASVSNQLRVKFAEYDKVYFSNEANKEWFKLINSGEKYLRFCFSEGGPLCEDCVEIYGASAEEGKETYFAMYECEPSLENKYSRSLLKLNNDLPKNIMEKINSYLYVTVTLHDSIIGKLDVISYEGDVGWLKIKKGINRCANREEEEGDGVKYMGISIVVDCGFGECLIRDLTLVKKKRILC